MRRWTKRPRRRAKKLEPIQRVEYLLEQGTLEEMRLAKEYTQKLLSYHWQYYSELAYQRRAIEDKISLALSQGCIENYRFEKWQRAVKWKYSLHPLCALGSLADPGGRFNIGDVNAQDIPMFPAIYLASDKSTASQETLIPPEKRQAGLTSVELALINPQSETFVSVSGTIERVFDLKSQKSLNKFVQLVKGFKLSSQVFKMAKELSSDPPALVQTEKQLFDELLKQEWRNQPMQVDVPANSQIFGQLVHHAGIDGILYNSICTGKECLAVFPRNFEKSSSIIQFDDSSPDARVPNKLDATNWKIAEQKFSELVAN